MIEDRTVLLDHPIETVQIRVSTGFLYLKHMHSVYHKIELTIITSLEVKQQFELNLQKKRNVKYEILNQIYEFLYRYSALII